MSRPDAQTVESLEHQIVPDSPQDDAQTQRPLAQSVMNNDPVVFDHVEDVTRQNGHLPWSTGVSRTHSRIPSASVLSLAGSPDEEEAAVGDAAPPVLKAANLAATLALAAAMASRLA